MRRSRTIDPEKEKYWRLVLKKFVESELPFKKFCELERISPNTFQYWRRELRLRDEARGSKPTITKGDNRPDNERQKKVNFWLNVIDELNSYSGGVNQYCREKGISSGNLWHWERKLVAQGLTEGTTAKKQSKALLPVRVVNPAPLTSHQKANPETMEKIDRIEIRARNGNQIFFPLGMSVEVLIRVANELGGNNC